MNRKRRSTPSRPALLDPVAEPSESQEPETAIEPVAFPMAPGSVTECVAIAAEPSAELRSDEALAIRRLRNTLIQKLFTPDRSQNSWTELKATN